MVSSSRVYLVGAGPGDPELLTIKAQRLLSEAEVVVYDRLVSPEILDLVPPGKARIFVGKAPNHHHMPQDEINDLLVSLARSHHSVLRLKGGDSFIFGRGGEEALYLARHGVPFEVVPGVTAASGISASLGVPLTHRGLATGVRFVTGKCRADADLELDWAGLADPETTIVFYMGLANLPRIATELIAAGLSPDTPAAAVTKGTVPEQRQCIATLERLASVVAKLEFKAPVLIVIGRVLRLAEMLNWQGLSYEDAIVDREDERPARA